MSLGDAHWDADMARLADSIGLPKPPRALAAGALARRVLAAALVGGWVALRPDAPPPPPPAPDASARLLGVWVAPVRYAWGDRYSRALRVQAPCR